MKVFSRDIPKTGGAAVCIHLPPPPPPRPLEIEITVGVKHLYTI